MNLPTIKRDYLTHPRTRPALKNAERYTLRRVSAIVAHWTANTDRGANAAAHRAYFNLGLLPASAHYCVDDRSIVQCIPDREVGYHCGDTPMGRGKYKPAGMALIKGFPGLTPNYFTVGVEMCVNSDGDWQKTRANSAQLYAYLLAKHNLPLSGLIRHVDVTGKLCPRMFLEDAAWADFQAQVGEILEDYHGAARATVNTKGLNLRSGPGASFPIVTELKMGEPVVLFETSGQWVRVETGGWVNSKFLLAGVPYNIRAAVV